MPRSEGLGGDHTSGGRLVLAIAGGWFEQDSEAYGHQFGDRSAP